MVLSFFRGGDDSHLEHIEHEISTMLGDCRHSFDLAMSALVTDADLTPLGEEVRATDRRINGAEESVRRELIVHSAVKQGADITMVLTSLLVVKKLERVGDQNKNIFDLAAEGFHLSGAADLVQINEYKNQVSSLIAEAAPLMNAGEDAEVDAFEARAQTLMDTLDGHINALMHSDDPARDAVPRAMLYRYLKRIVANISGVVTATHRPLDRSDVPDIDE